MYATTVSELFSPLICNKTLLKSVLFIGIGEFESRLIYESFAKSKVIVCH